MKYLVGSLALSKIINKSISDRDIDILVTDKETFKEFQRYDLSMFVDKDVYTCYKSKSGKTDIKLLKEGKTLEDYLEYSAPNISKVAINLDTGFKIVDELAQKDIDNKTITLEYGSDVHRLDKYKQKFPEHREIRL